MNERPRYLADLANEDRAAQTPRRVEAALRQRVAAAASRKTSVWNRFRLWPAIAGAVVVAALWLLLPRTPEAPQKLELSKTASPVVEPLVRPATSEASPVRTASIAPPPQPKPVRANALPRVKTPIQERITRRFYELAYAPPELLANSRVMRVRVPRAALLSFGLPLNAYQAQDEKVAADVIYTEDGIARAIRFVENNNYQE